MTINTAAIKTPEAAIKAQTLANLKRAWADQKEARDPIGARWERLEAADLDARAAHALDPSSSLNAPLDVGRGGELIVETAGVLTSKGERLRDTVTSNPDMIAARASTNRLELAAEAGVLSMAVDAADTIQTANSLEKMLAAQLATLHMLALKNAATARTFADRASDMYVPDNQRQTANIEATRSANAAARASEAFQRGMLTLDKLRNGGRQNVVVQHVNVGNGAQAVVAGAVNAMGACNR